MSQAIQLYFRPTELHFIESLRTETELKYNVTARVHFYSDEAMMKELYQKEFLLADVPYNPTWDGILSDIYTLINTAL